MAAGSILILCSCRSHNAAANKLPVSKPEVVLNGSSGAVFNIKDYGATGEKSRNCQAAIQKTIDACAKLGGGVVYVPPGEYTSGQITLRSNIRFYIEAGATIYGSRDANDWQESKRALIYGENLQNISIEGYGTLDGQAEHKWFPFAQKQDDSMLQCRIDAIKAAGITDMPFAKWTLPVYKMIVLVNCKDVQIKGISLLNSPIWNIHPRRCERLLIDGVYIYSSLIDGVNSDGIDPDCCKDVRISNCIIETGDDCISLKSDARRGGESGPCENIMITNCRFTSASAAVKIGDEIFSPIRHVLIDNCVIRNSHRGFAFMILDGGEVSDVIISNLTIECSRHDWFWWGQGDPFYFMIGKRNENSGLGKFKNILIKNVIARAKGSSIISGHPDSPLEGITLDNVKIFMSIDPNNYFQEAVNGIECQNADDLTLRDIEIVWDKPASKKWRSALYLKDIGNLTLDGFVGRQAYTDANEPAVVLDQVDGANIRNCKAMPGTGEFLHFSGDKTKDILLFGNDFSKAKVQYGQGQEVNKNAIRALNNIPQ